MFCRGNRGLRNKQNWKRERREICALLSLKTSDFTYWRQWVTGQREPKRRKIGSVRFESVETIGLLGPVMVHRSTNQFSFFFFSFFFFGSAKETVDWQQWETGREMRWLKAERERGREMRWRRAERGVRVIEGKDVGDCCLSVKWRGVNN